MLKIAVMALALAASAGAAAAGRLDPYKSDRFALDKNGHPVAGANQAALPRASGEVVKHRAGGDAGSFHKSPGRNKFEPITLERGLTHDSSFANWAAGAGGGHHPGRRGRSPRRK
jgi:phage tail-like protein